MKKFIIISLSIITTSCATIMNDRGVVVKVVTKAPAMVSNGSDTLPTNPKNEALFYVPRSREPLSFHIFNDSLSKDITVNSRHSLAFWLNLYPTTAWFGFLIDLMNPKRFTYPSPIYVGFKDTRKGYTLLEGFRRKKGICEMNISFPYINSFLLKPPGEGYKSSNGFLGLAIGADYYHLNDRFLNFTISGVLNNLVPAPVGVDRWSGHYEDYSSLNFNISDNFLIKKISVGYGLSFKKLRWRLQDINEDYTMNEYKLIKYGALGFVFPFYYHFSDNFYAGVVYQPDFIQLGSKVSTNYEHIISVDFGCKISLGK